jgi:hypothetical protein
MTVTRLKTLLCSLALAGIAAGAAHTQALAKTPACAADAAARAESLLKFHVTDAGKAPEMEADVAPIEASEVTSLGPLKPLRGKGRYEVLEVIGHVIKADYRIHLIYAKIGEDCLLMGQEILEVDSPF